MGDKTYCLVSGVAFQITPASIKREVGGKTLHFCCEGCAGYFDANQERVAKLRKVPIL
jgi:YHS domain-containing protein